MYDISLFSYVVKNKKSHGTRSGECGRCGSNRILHFTKSIFVITMQAGAVMVQNPVAGAPLHKAMSAHTVA